MNHKTNEYGVALASTLLTSYLSLISVDLRCCAANLQIMLIEVSLLSPISRTRLANTVLVGFKSILNKGLKFLSVALMLMTWRDLHNIIGVHIGG